MSKNNDRIAEMEAALAALKAENQALKEATKQSAVGTSYKPSAKGCLSLYGIRQRGIHHYAEEWMTIFENEARHLAAMASNWSGLTFKDEERARERLVARAAELGVELEFDTRDRTTTRAAVVAEAEAKAAARAAAELASES